MLPGGDWDAGERQAGDGGEENHCLRDVRGERVGNEGKSVERSEVSERDRQNAGHMSAEKAEIEGQIVPKGTEAGVSEAEKDGAGGDAERGDGAEKWVVVANSGQDEDIGKQ